jgi:starvation-inducible DNA-binding protein
MNDLIKKLAEVFASNFVAYYRSHVAHVNITGRNFYSDHKLLKKVYENLQDQIDTIAEFLRSVESFMPESLADVLDLTAIPDDMVMGDSDSLLRLVCEDLQTLVALYRELETEAEDAGQDQIANFAQDQETVLTKQIWMITSTIGDAEPEEEDYDD